MTVPPTGPGSPNDGYPPPGYPPPGYPLPGYAAFGYPGYSRPVQPGIIPMRPLTLGDIITGAIRSIRANAKATLGLTLGVVVVTQAVVLAVRIGSLAAVGDMRALNDEMPQTRGDFAVAASSDLFDGLIQFLVTTVLTGILTVVVGRSVFGSTTSIGEAWQRIRGRLLPLIAIALLETAGAVVLFGATGLVIASLAMAANGFAAFAVGVPLVLAVMALVVWLATMLYFAPVVVVLEHKSVWEALTRSFALVRDAFWRVLGIRVLAGLLTIAVAIAVSVPFSIAAAIVAISSDSLGTAVFETVLAALGSAIGQVIAMPFIAAVSVLLYTDRRFRVERFDLLLHSGTHQTAGSFTDDIWMTGSQSSANPVRAQPGVRPPK